MYPDKDRVASLLQNALDELDLLQKMSAGINTPDDFVTNLSGLTAFRACGMRIFLSHEYGQIDNEGFFNTIKTNIPDLIPVTRQILADLQSGKN